MIAKTLAGRIDITLGLTVASHIVGILLPLSTESTLLKATIAFAAVLAFIERFVIHSGMHARKQKKGRKTTSKEEGAGEHRPPTSSSSTDDGDDDEAGTRRIAANAVAIVRRLSVLVFVQLVLDGLQPKHTRTAENVILDIRENAESFSLFSHIPLTVWPMVESFVTMLLAILILTFISRMITLQLFSSSSTFSALSSTDNEDDDDDHETNHGNSNNNLPELERLLYSIQYLFADNVALLFQDHRIKRLIGFAGAVGIAKLSEMANSSNNNNGSNGDSSDPNDGDYFLGAPHVWFSGIAMGWVNLSVQILIPDARWSTSPWIEMITALGAAVMLQAMQSVFNGVDILQGYLEWHLSVVLDRIAQAEGLDTLNVVVVCAAIIWILRPSPVTTLFQNQEKDYVGHGTTIAKPSKTLVNIATLLLVNTIAKSVMQYATDNSVADNITIIMIGIIFTRGAVKIYSSMQEKLE